MTTSLTILPQRQPPLRQAEITPQRPKLHLNTQQLTVSQRLGKSSSLRLDTLSAISPTARNTFSNAYEAPASAAPALGKSSSKPRLSIDSSVTVQPSPSSATASSASTLNSGSTSASSTDSATIRIPYKQPHNLTSILSNSPAASLRPRKMTPARPLFPASKKVSFRMPLEEEITTVKYTLAHSDIGVSVQSDESVASILESSIVSSTETIHSQSEVSQPLNATLSIPSTSDSSSTSSSPSISPSRSVSPAFSSEGSPPRLRGPRAGQKRDSSSSDSDSEDSCPETPVAGRRKRRREWVWTLGPISSSSETTSSDDSN